ncbi:MAG: energy-coupling factor ABC transporter substrate-binding protein [Methanobacterium sp.]
MVNKRVIILLSLVAVIIIFPLALYNGKGEDQGYFTGTDGQGPAYLESQGYQPWFHPLWEPPSSEIQVLLFSVQAAIGALIIGYFIGFYKGIAKARKREEMDEKNKKVSKSSK